MDPVVHFEMPAEDTARMSEFYVNIFGWKTMQLGPDMGNYVLVQTDETDEKGMLKETNRINGGFARKTDDNQHTVLVIAVDNIQESMKKVTDAGGKIVYGQTPGEPDLIPGVGLYIQFLDTEGNRVGMLQPTEGMM
jgi:predicted enzyme related to lactoylglutathione lyase